MKVGNIRSLEGGKEFTTYMKAFGQNTMKRSRMPLGHPLNSRVFSHVAHLQPKFHGKKKVKASKPKSIPKTLIPSSKA